MENAIEAQRAREAAAHLCRVAHIALENEGTACMLTKTLHIALEALGSSCNCATARCESCTLGASRE